MTSRFTKPDTSWFAHDRFGMFIHWGLYALPARHEWIRNYEQISNADYQKFFDHFNPDLFDPKEWARRAKQAGMQYFVITTKHHEGFCLWPTQH
ncbi:MAG: alpha-L-fucosidase, partial [Roseiflexaceae bacterium]